MSARENLTVDLAAASVPPNPQDVEAWAASESVFVSSLITDLKAERAAVRQAVTAFGARPVMFEDELGAQDVSAERAYLDGLAMSTIYLGVYGDRYGQPLASGYSATHEEFRAADAGTQRMMLFTGEPFDGDGQQRDFVGGIRQRYTTSGYTDPAHLAAKVGDRLASLATEVLTPWVILGTAAFRATSIRATAESVTISALVRQNKVVDLLREYADRRSEVPFAAPHQSGGVLVTELGSETRSAGSQLVDITLRRVHGSSGVSLLNMGVNGLSAEEVFERGFTAMLFDGDMPQMLSYMRPDDALAPVKGAGLPDPVLRSLTHLLLGEFLRENGAPGGVDRLILGPSKPGGRALEVTWSPARRYSNVPAPAPRTVAGVVAGM